MLRIRPQHIPVSRSAGQAERGAGLVMLWLRFLLVVGISGSLAACATQLVPDFDGELLEGIIESNKTAQVLFAKVETGSPAADYPARADEYAEAIAAFEALRLRADARPFPPMSKHIAKLKFLQGVCAPESDPESCLDSTTKALELATGAIRALRDEHRSNGLSPVELKAAKGQYDQAIDQALTVETALNR